MSDPKSVAAHGVLRAAGRGALIGGAAALAITYLPRALAGDRYYEATDALVVFVAVLVPLGAGVGALGATTRRPAGTGRSPGRLVVALAGLVLLVAILWQVWAILTGAPRLL